jgi:ubiquinone/menaquinone biosynthesis C-methylase UbiE
LTTTPYIIGGGIDGRERLRVLSRAMAPLTGSLLDRVGVARGMACLDAGCGGGDVTLELSRRVGRAGRVVGIDIDQTQLALAREEAAAAGRQNVEYYEHDVTRDDPEGGFDLVFARFLLTHMPDPAAACRRLARAVRPGGLLAVEDIDFSGAFCHPWSEAYRR